MKSRFGLIGGVIALAVLIRFLLMPFLGHEDIRVIYLASLDVPFRGFDAPYLFAKSVYPPVIYALFGFWHLVAEPFFGSGFLSWLNEGIWSSFLDPFVFRYFFLMKLPYLFFDLVAAWGVSALFTDSQTKKKALVLWLFNPVNLYVTYAFGQFDIIPTSFVVISVLLFYRKHYFWSLVFVGIASTFKLFPLFFVPIFVVLADGGFRKKIFYFATGLIPFILSVVPFLSNAAFREHVLFSDHTRTLQYASFHIGSDRYIYLFIIFYCFFVLWLSSHGSRGLLWRYVAIVTLSYYAFSFFHVQWFLWGVPFLVVMLFSDKAFRLPIFLLLGLYFIVILLFEPTLTWGMLRSFNLSFGSFPSMGELASRFVDIERIEGYVRSFIAGIVFYCSYLLLKGGRYAVEKD